MRTVLKRVEKYGQCDVREVASMGNSGHQTLYSQVRIYMYLPDSTTVDETELDLGTLKTSVARTPSGDEIRFKGRQNNVLHIDVGGTYVVRPKPLNLIDHEEISNKRYGFVLSARRYVKDREDVVTWWNDVYRGDQYRYVWSIGFTDDTNTIVRRQWRTQILRKGIWVTKNDSTTTVRWASCGHGIYPARVDPLYLEGVTVIPEKIPTSWLDEFDEKCDEQLTFGQLGLEAAKSKRLLDINTILYVKDIMSLPKLATSIVGPEVLKSLGSGDFRKVVKQASKLFLADHYGLQLTVADTQKIADMFSKLDLHRETEYVGAEERYSISHGMATGDVKVTRKLTGVVCAWSDGQLEVVNSISEGIQQLQRKVLNYGYNYDILPSLANIWDGLPFSFVVDWFTGIGDYLSDVENANYLQTFTPKVVYESTTYDWSQEYASSHEGYEVIAYLHCHAYKRHVSRQFRSYTPRLNSPKPSGPVKHGIEAGALLCGLL